MFQSHFELMIFEVMISFQETTYAFLQFLSINKVLQGQVLGLMESLSLKMHFYEKVNNRHKSLQFQFCLLYTSDAADE